jgi:hypothetical protein
LKKTTHHEGDQNSFGHARIDKGYRKTTQGYDAFQKILVKSVKREVEDEKSYPTHLRKEFGNGYAASSQLYSIRDMWSNS